MKTRLPRAWTLPVVLTGLCWGLPAAVQAVDAASTAKEACSREEAVRFRGATVRLENDLFTGTDQNYTNGVGLILVSHDIPGKLRTDCLPAPCSAAVRRCGAWSGN